MRAVLVAGAALILAGCGDDTAPAPAPSVVETPTPCSVLEVRATTGECIAVGVPPDGCADGFEHDGDGGCFPVLPSAPCGPGTMALPGDTACRGVQACGASPWGDFADGATVFVDASFSGTGSDGSEASPWTRIQDAVDVAPEGSVIAIAAGRYAETVAITRTLHLRGRCPELVSVSRGAPTEPTVLVYFNAHGTTVSGLGIEGASIGIGVSDALDVVLERLWIHDTGGRGVVVQDTLGEASATLRDSLVERATDVSVFVAGAPLTIERSVIREGRPLPVAGTYGHGVSAIANLQTRRRAELELRGSVIADARSLGVEVAGSDADIEGSLVRGTLPGDGGGAGIIGRHHGGLDATVHVRGSVVDRGIDVGVGAVGATVTIEATTIGEVGSGPIVTARGGVVAVQIDGVASSATVTATRIQDVAEVGIATKGAAVGVDRVLVRRAAMGLVSSDDESGSRLPLAVTTSIFEDDPIVGIAALGIEVTLESVLVRGAQAGELLAGRGIYVQHSPVTLARSSGSIRGGRVERATVFGLAVISSDVDVDGLEIVDTEPGAAGVFGDGIAIVTLEAGRASVSCANVRVENSARAGIASFGSDVAVATSSMLCNGLALTSQYVEGQPPSFDDRGGNACGCETAVPCQIVSVDLIAPEPLQ